MLDRGETDKYVGNSSSSMSFECEVQNDVDTEETDVGEIRGR